MSHNPIESSNSFLKQNSRLRMRPRHLFVPISTFTGMIGAAGVDVGAHTGAPIQQEISTIGLVGLLMDTAADEVNHLMQLPSDFDRTHPLYIAVNYTTGSADPADTITWLIRYLAIVPNVTTLISPATAVAKEVGIQTVTGTAYTMQKTGYARINGGAIADNVELIALEVELDAFAAGLTEDKILLGVDLMYTPKFLQYGSMKAEAKEAIYMLSEKYS